MLASIGWPVLDRIHLWGDFAISPHGIGIAVGFLFGAWILQHEGPKRGVSVEHINTMVFWALIGTIIGARLFYVIGHFSEFNGIADMLALWNGGLTLLGGIAGAVLINIPLFRKYHYSFFQVMDGAVIGLAFGIAFGRIGDLIIGDHLGKPTSWLLAWTYEGGKLAPPFRCVNEQCAANLQGTFTQTIDRTQAVLRDAGQIVEQGIGVHQTAMYDMILAGLIFAFLWWFIRSPRREGIATLTFGLAYGCCRLLEDSLRIDKRFGPFTGSQWTALTVALICLGLLISFAITKRPGPTTPSRRDRIPEGATPDDAAPEDAAPATT